jgi:hypothetical protein
LTSTLQSGHCNHLPLKGLKHPCNGGASTQRPTGHLVSMQYLKPSPSIFLIFPHLLHKQSCPTPPQSLLLLPCSHMVLPLPLDCRGHHTGSINE